MNFTKLETHFYKNGHAFYSSKSPFIYEAEAYFPQTQFQIKKAIIFNMSALVTKVYKGEANEYAKWVDEIYLKFYSNEENRIYIFGESDVKDQ